MKKILVILITIITMVSTPVYADNNYEWVIPAYSDPLMTFIVDFRR